MNKKIFGYLLLPLAFCTLSGCDGFLSKKEAITEIQLEESIPTAYVDEEYDFSDCFVKEDGFTYTIEVFSYNGASFEESKLETNGLCFTPKNTDPISVILHASNGKTSFQKTVSVDVKEKGDPIEELLLNTGASGYADPGFQKNFNTQVSYKRPGEKNKTSIVVSYSGNQNYYAGGAVFCPNNFRCLDYWKDKTWENAILRFWCYNDSDYEIEFGLRIKDEYTGTVDLDMTQEGNPSKIAAPHEWTEILFPLRPLGITHTLYQSEDGKRNDSFTVKAKWGGVTYYSDSTQLITHPIPMHSYNFYLDEIDVVPASDYPDIQTNLPDTMDRMVNGTWCEHFNREINFDPNYIHEGESSIKFDFIGPTTKAGSQGMCLNDPKLVELWEDQKWDNAIMNFWIYNDSQYNINVQFLLVDSVRNFVVDWNSEYSMNEIAKPGEWTHILYSMNKLGVNRPLYKDSTVKDEFNIKFLWDGPENTPYTFYVDDVNVQDASKYPEVDTTVFVPARTETLADGWENMQLDDGWQIGTVTTETVCCTATNPDSVTSKKVTLAKVTKADPQDIVLATEYDKNSGNLQGLPNLSNKKLEFDVKFSEAVTNHEVKVKVIQDGWEITHIATLNPQEISGSDGWYHASIDYSLIPEASGLTDVIRIGFYFSGAEENIRGNAFVYLDNIFVK